jgi:hypothetical protein
LRNIGFHNANERDRTYRGIIMKRFFLAAALGLASLLTVIGTASARGTRSAHASHSGRAASSHRTQAVRHNASSHRTQAARHKTSGHQAHAVRRNVSAHQAHAVRPNISHQAHTNRPNVSHQAHSIRPNVSHQAQNRPHGHPSSMNHANHPKPRPHTAHATNKNMHGKPGKQDHARSRHWRPGEWQGLLGGDGSGDGQGAPAGDGAGDGQSVLGGGGADGVVGNDAGPDSALPDGATIASDPGRYGVMITQVYEGTARRQGLQRGDVIVGFNGMDTSTFEDLRAAVQASGPTATVTYLSRETGEARQVRLNPANGAIGIYGETVQID